MIQLLCAHCPVRLGSRFALGVAFCFPPAEPAWGCRWGWVFNCLLSGFLRHLLPLVILSLRYYVTYLCYCWHMCLLLSGSICQAKCHLLPRQLVTVILCGISAHTERPPLVGVLSEKWSEVIGSILWSALTVASYFPGGGFLQMGLNGPVSTRRKS